MTTASLTPTVKSSFLDVSNPREGFGMEFIVQFPLDLPALGNSVMPMEFLTAVLLVPRNKRDVVTTSGDTGAVADHIIPSLVGEKQNAGPRQRRETDYLGISMLAGVAVKGGKGTETGCIAGVQAQFKSPKFCGGRKQGLVVRATPTCYSNLSPYFCT